MDVTLKPLNQQVVVITGASSGIGLATARLAATRGAKVVLSSHDEPALRQATEEILREGGQAIYVTADVADYDALLRVARSAIDFWGGFDTWINNAGIHHFSRIRESAERDMRRIFDVNYWGTVHGCRIAADHLKRRGGALITIGSVLSSRSVPLQGFYAASKHAVKAYVEAMRMELADAGAPVSVTLIKPAAIDTPIVEHSRSRLEGRAQLPFPLYDPEIAARGILHCAEHPRRDLVIGGAGFVAETLEKVTPNLTDRLMEWFFFRMQQTKGPPRERDALHRPLGNEPRVRGPKKRFTFRRSLYTSMSMNRLASTVVAAGAIAGGYALYRNRTFSP